MKMSQGVEWGLHCLTALSELPAGESASRRLLAEYFGLPDAYLAKQLKLLAREGILIAGTGPQGGFRLARPAAQISVLEVVEAIEGRGSAFLCDEIRQGGVCATPPESCRRICPIAKVMYDADSAWRDALRVVSVADLAVRVPRIYRARAASWLGRSGG